MDLRGKVAFVTGASQGIGRACAMLLAEAGADVALGSRNLGKLESVAKDVQNLGRKPLIVPLDVSNRDSIAEGAGSALKAFGKIDILVNNAGITKDNLAMRMKPEDWEIVLRTNLDGAYYCIRALLPGMVKQRYGRIINIASVVAQAGNAGQANYIASKAGLIGLTKAVAAEVASRNITVNAVAPGFIRTAMTEKLPEAVEQRLLSLIPLGRMGTDREVAHGVRFLASDEAGYITGHVLNINGGMYMA
ncbi:MAG: 3-oxoacyl-[acyl-carrier-protein] reductase [Acidobacteria bacterium]|nr:MAG: 3-oxoacyl-[acyl-carrier-protein] reductase [Acidobacteriota bacterium]